MKTKGIAMNKNNLSVLAGIFGLALAKQKFGSNARKSKKFIKMRVEFDFLWDVTDLREQDPSTDEIVDSVEYFFNDLLPKYQEASNAWRKRYRRNDGFNRFTSDVAKMCQRLDMFCEAGLDNLEPDELEYLFQEIFEQFKSLHPLGFFSEYIGWSGDIGDGTPLGAWVGLSKEFSDALCIPINIEEGVAFDKNGFFGSIIGSGIDAIRPVHDLDLDYDANDIPILPPEWTFIDNNYINGVKIGRAYIEFYFNVPASKQQTPILFIEAKNTVESFLRGLFAGDREGLFSRETSLEYDFDITSIEIEDNLDIPQNVRTMFDLAKRKKSELRRF